MAILMRPPGDWRFAGYTGAGRLAQWRALAKALVGQGLLPTTAGIDALHLAMATVHEVHVLMTWNCRHLANAAILGELGEFVRTKGYKMPTVCTPEELMGGEYTE